MAEPVVDTTPVGPNVVGSITTDDGFEVQSNFQTADQLEAEVSVERAVLKEPDVKPEPRRRNRRDDPRVAVETAIGRQREAERLAKESADRIAALEAENAELKKPKPAPVAPAPAPVAPQRAMAAPVASAPPPVTEAAYKRFMAMPDAPKPDQFPGENGWHEYQFAVGAFITEKTVQETFQRVQHQNAEQQAHAQFSERLAAAKVRIPDFDQRFNPQTPIDTRVIPHIQRLENAPDVMLYLSEHQDIAQRLTTLHPVDQIGQIGEIAGMLKAQSAAAPSSPASARPAISQAKPPTKRVVGAPPAATDEPPDDDASEEAHEAYWGPRRQEIRRRHR